MLCSLLSYVHRPRFSSCNCLATFTVPLSQQSLKATPTIHNALADAGSQLSTRPNACIGKLFFTKSSLCESFKMSCTVGPYVQLPVPASRCKGSCLASYQSWPQCSDERISSWKRRKACIGDGGKKTCRYDLWFHLNFALL